MRQSSGDTLDLIQGFAQLDLGYPVLDPTLTFICTDFEGSLGNRLAREYTGPDLAAMLHVAGQYTTRGFDLTSSKTATASGL